MAVAVARYQACIIACHMLLLPGFLGKGLLEHALAEEDIGIMDIVGYVVEIEAVGDIADLASVPGLSHHHIARNDAAVIEGDGSAALQRTPQLSLGNPKLDGLLREELPFPLLLHQAVAIAWLGMDQRECLDGEPIALVHDAGLHGNHLDLVVYIHIKDTALRLDILGKLLRPYDIERLDPVHLGR